MLFPHKKGVISGIIVILLSLGLITTLFLRTTERVEDEFEGYNCWFTIGLQRAAEAIPIFTYENTCTTMLRSIPSVSRSQIESKQDIAKEIADKIGHAHFIVHEGNVEDLWDEEKGFFQFNNGCLVLYELNVDYIPKGETLTQKDLFDYMSVTGYKHRDGKEETYLNYVRTSKKGARVTFPESVEVKSRQGQEYLAFIDAEIKEGGQYAVSIVSPTTSELFDKTSFLVSVAKTANAFRISNYLDPSDPASELLDVAEDLLESTKGNLNIMFSSLRYAQEKGCKIQMGPKT